MQRALQLAEKGRYTCSPNPMVGCVIVRDGKIVGEGYHRYTGEPHAEINALMQAKNAANGAIAYVNLEPCSVSGRTPPCVDALIKAKIKHVVIGCIDANPRVAGSGVRALAKAGIAVTTGINESASRELNRIFFHAITKGKPYVIAKYAMSIDGKLATVSGDSKWLTGEKARENVHYWRRQSDAILVGSGTIARDDPRLTVRLPDQEIPETQHPLRIVLNGNTTLNKTKKIFTDALPGKTVLASALLGSAKQRINLHKLLKKLYSLNINSLLVEGGAQTLTQFFAADLVDEIHCYVAAKLVGGAKAPTAFMGTGIARMIHAKSYRLYTVDRFMDDVLLVYRKSDNV